MQKNEYTSIKFVTFLLNPNIWGGGGEYSAVGRKSYVFSQYKTALIRIYQFDTALFMTNTQGFLFEI